MIWTWRIETRKIDYVRVNKKTPETLINDLVQVSDLPLVNWVR